MPYALFEGPDGRPTVPRCTATGEVFVAGGGGGGDATLAEQQVQTGHLATIALACDVPTSDVVAAIEALGATATIADVVGLLTTDASTQSNILAKLTEIGVDADASATSLVAIESAVDDLETINAAIRDRLPTNLGAQAASGSLSTARAIASTNPTGAISAASSGTLKASPGRLLSFRVEGVSNGTYYLQLHDAASTGAISAGTIKGLGYEIGGSGDEFAVQFAAPISFASGISWAISSTKNTYTASASTAFVEGVWE
jgi:hypothetical protein